MAKIKVIGSSSKGNSYVVETSGGYLILEAGIKAHDVLRTCKYDRKNIVGCLISHIHGDHAKFAKDIHGMGIRTFSNKETIEALGFGEMLTPDKWNTLGAFHVYPFLCMHDVPNFGYVIKHSEFGTILFATDTFAFPSVFKGIKHYLIEANYSDEILAASNTDEAQKRRLLVSHMSLDYAVKYLHQCHAENADTITLIHLSSRHSDADQFKTRVQAEFGQTCYIADKGVEIDITNQIL